VIVNRLCTECGIERDFMIPKCSKCGSEESILLEYEEYIEEEDE